jgi:protein O-GlcNAc transferase
LIVSVQGFLIARVIKEANLMKSEDSGSSKPNVLETMKLEEALRLARRKSKDNQPEEAKEIYEEILLKYPKHKLALTALTSLKGAANSVVKDPSSNQMQPLIDLYSQGRFEQALSESNQMLERFPNSVALYNILGASHMGLMQFSAAIQSFKLVLKLKPDSPITHYNMGLALNTLGETEAALSSYRKAIEIKPDYHQAFNNMGTTLQNKGDTEGAIACYNSVLTIMPGNSDAYYNIGNALKSKEDIDGAIDSYGKALKIKPNFAEAHNNLGSVLQSKGAMQAAVNSCKQALAIKPDYAEAYNNMGNILVGMDDLEIAISSYKQATEINPAYAEAYNNMAIAFNNKGDHETAVNTYKQALKIKPDYAEAYNNMGVALKDNGDLEGSIQSYEHAISIKSDCAEAFYNYGVVLSQKGALSEAIKSYEMALNIKPTYQAARSEKLYRQSHTCDWKALEVDQGFISTLGISTDHISPLALQSFEDAPARHRARSEVFMRELHGYKRPLPESVRPSKKPHRLRIGYFSADFHEHPVAYLMAKVIETHDRMDFEVYGYSIGPAKDDDMRKRLIKAFDVFDNVSNMNDKDIALLARQDNIDIAIDLTGHTLNSRPGVFAYRAAPVQINYLGYSGTMGTDFIDYIIADPVVIPTGYEHYYNERILRLPNTFMPTDNTRKMSTRPMSRSEAGLPDNGFVFCCFNNNYKIRPQEFDIWMRVLLEVEGSVLWLRNSNEWSETNLRYHVETRGVDPSRLIFAGRVPMDEHLARHKLADLFLDTFTYNAHTTATEALWAGLPVVTKAGKGFSARAAASLLTAADLPELITETEQQYEALIVNLSSNPERLAQIREKLANNIQSSPLFNTERYTKHIENGYQQAYQRYFDGGLAKDIIVPEDC